MGQLRIEKIQELMKQEISQIILQELKDPRIGFVTVTQVEVTRDLSLAKVYVSIFPYEKAAATLDVIESQNRAIRGALGNRMRNQVKSIPELQFFIDDSLEYIENIDSLLKK